jgi:hypothetical protein
MIVPASTNSVSPPALDKLHDFYQPPPAPWTPQTIGWYLVFGALMFFLLWLAIRGFRHWHHNRYRRAALKELASTPPELLSALLKRTALIAWPREAVASLNGPNWLAFLTETSAIPSFQEAPGNRIEEIAFASSSFSSQEEQRIRDLTAQWIRRHRVQA